MTVLAVLIVGRIISVATLVLRVMIARRLMVWLSVLRMSRGMRMVLRKNRRPMSGLMRRGLAGQVRIGRIWPILMVALPPSHRTVRP